MELNDYIGKHSGQKAWIFGKGPSYDDFDISTAGPLRVCINHTVSYVPEPTYFAACDGDVIRDVCHNYPERCTAILHKQNIPVAAECGIPWTVSYDGYVHPDKRREYSELSVDEFASLRRMWSSDGSVLPAISFLWLTGVRDIVMVGFDGTGGYAPSLNLPHCSRDWTFIREYAIQEMDMLGIKYEFAGE